MYEGPSLDFALLMAALRRLFRGVLDSVMVWFAETDANRFMPVSLVSRVELKRSRQRPPATHDRHPLRKLGGAVAPSKEMSVDGGD